MLIFDASSEAFGHIATALRSHRLWARNSGLHVPDELLEFEKICVLRAKKGQAGTPLAELWRIRETKTVTRLLPYEDAAVFLGCSVRHVKRLVAGGLLPAVRVGTGSLTRIRVADLEAFVDQLATINERGTAA